MSQDSITFTSRGDLPPTPDGLTGLLVECAPDATWVPRGAFPITDLLGSSARAKSAGATLLQKLLEREPEFDGVRHMYALKEILIHAATDAYRALNLHGFLQKHGIANCVFRSPTPIAQSLTRIGEWTATPYNISIPRAPNRNPMGATLGHVRRNGLGGLWQVPTLGLHRLLPLTSRVLLHRRHAQGDPGAWWFYSTFYTFTNIGLAYEKSLRCKFHYMIADPGSAEKPLKRSRRDWTEIYGYLSPSQIPSGRELGRIRQQLVEHLLGMRLSDEELLVRNIMMESAEFKLFLERLLPLGCLQARAFDKWFERERPALLVVGNESQEGYLLQKARTVGLRTLLLQHGILGDFYQATEHSADVLVVRGEFWRKFVSEKSRERCVVLNCESPEANTAGAPGRELLFVTTDYTYHRLFHLEDLVDILRECVRVAAQLDRTLLIRIHPRESTALYRQILERLSSEGFNANLEFSQGPELDRAISRSAVAVLYSSTVFLDCLRLGVPIVSFDWHDFAYKEQLKQYGVFNFAENLKHLNDLLVDGLTNRLKPATNYDDFLAPTSVEAIHAFFEAAPSGFRMDRPLFR